MNSGSSNGATRSWRSAVDSRDDHPLRLLASVASEALRACWAQPRSAVVIMALIGGLCAGVLLTVGESVAAEGRVLARIDEAGTRSLIIRGPESEPLSPALVRVLQGTREVEQVAAFGPIRDAYPRAVGGGPAIGVRATYGDLADTIGRLPVLPGAGDVGVASPDTARAAGFTAGVGALTRFDGVTVQVVRPFDLPDHLAFLDPVVLLPASVADGEGAAEAGLTLIVIVARTPSDVRGVEALVRNALGADGSSEASVETSQSLAEVRASVSGELSGFRRQVVLGSLVGGMGLVGLSVFATTVRRRRDFGRQRALGATRRLVLLLVLLQVGLPATLGGLVGIGVSYVVNSALGRSSAPPVYALSLLVAVVAASLVSALVPAFVASRRDPLAELRIP